MDILREILTEVQQGKKSFRPASDSVSHMEDFQSVAKLLIHADKQNMLDSIISHRESRTSKRYYDLVSTSGLSHEGEVYLANECISLQESLKEDVVMLKPNFMGLGLDLNALSRWWKSRGKSA